MSKFLSTFLIYGKLPRKVKLLSLSNFIDTIGAFVTTLMVLILTQSKGLNIKEAGLFLSFTGLLQVSTTTVSAHLADKIGPKKVYVFYNLSAAICMFLCIPLFDTIYFYGLITLWPILKNAASPVGQSLVLSYAGNEDKKIIVSFLYMLSNLGNTIAPILAVWLYKKNLPLIFLIDGITTIFAIMIVLHFSKDWKSVFETTRKNPQKFTAILQKLLFSRSFLMVFMGAYFINFIFYQHVFSLPIFLAESGKEGYYGILMSFNCILVVLTSGLIASLTLHWNIIRTMIVGTTFICVGFFALALGKSLAIVLASTMFWSIGEILFYNSLRYFFIDSVSKENQSLGLSILPSLFSLSKFINPLLIGFLVTALGYQLCWLLSPVIGLIGVALIYLSTNNFRYKGKLNAISN